VFFRPPSIFVVGFPKAVPARSSPAARAVRSADIGDTVPQSCEGFRQIRCKGAAGNVGASISWQASGEAPGSDTRTAAKNFPAFFRALMQLHLFLLTFGWSQPGRRSASTPSSFWRTARRARCNRVLTTSSVRSRTWRSPVWTTPPRPHQKDRLIVFGSSLIA